MPNQPPTQPHLVHEIAIPGQFTIRLFQTGPDEFTVEYGMSTRRKLTQEEAQTQFGTAIFHALACAGKFRN